jgi:hypothetical protein
MFIRLTIFENVLLFLYDNANCFWNHGRLRQHYSVFATLFHDCSDAQCCDDPVQPPWCAVAAAFWPMTVPCFIAYRSAKRLAAKESPEPEEIKPKKVKTGSWK